MEPKDFYRQNVAFMKYMYDLTMNTQSAMFEYGEKMVEFMAGQSGAGNEDNKKFLKEWLANGRRARDELRRNMDEGFERVKELYE
jgi:hypothetical protein